MKRFLIFVSAHLFLFLLVIAYQAQADHEEWNINKFEKLVYARVSGEVTHGDSLNFFIHVNDDCDRVWNNFTFYTYEKPGDIKQLIGKHIPIRINNQDETAEVEAVTPFLMGYRVLFSIGTFDLKKYIYKLNDFYNEEKRFEIEIVDGVGFKAAKYFDIPNNNWKLDKLVPSVLEARKLCKTIDQVGS